MRFYPNLVAAVVQSLQSIFNENSKADKEIASRLKSDKRWGSRDRSFIAETTYDIVRWKRFYEEIAQVEAPYSKSDLYALFAVWVFLKGYELPDWVEFKESNFEEFEKRKEQVIKIRAIRESIPDWLDEVGKYELGKVWDDEIEALNKQADVVLRTNLLKNTRSDLIKTLSSENVDADLLEDSEVGLVLSQRKNLNTLESYQNGLFEIQDASSQRVAPFMDLQTGLTVIDACAGAGGKSLHIAELMQNKGKIIACDIYQSKLIELEKRAKRAGISILKTILLDENESTVLPELKADRVLIDAPCSGLGVLRRNPDSKWKLNPEFMDEIRENQLSLLKKYSKWVNENGKLIYATCSILPSENENQIKNFLGSEEGKEFKLVKEEKILVHQTGNDGFYMAMLER